MTDDHILQVTMYALQKISEDPGIKETIEDLESLRQRILKSQIKYPTVWEVTAEYFYKDKTPGDRLDECEIGIAENLEQAQSWLPELIKSAWNDRNTTAFYICELEVGNINQVEFHWYRYDKDGKYMEEASHPKEGVSG